MADGQDLGNGNYGSTDKLHNTGRDPQSVEKLAKPRRIRPLFVFVGVVVSVLVLAGVVVGVLAAKNVIHTSGTRKTHLDSSPSVSSAAGAAEDRTSIGPAEATDPAAVSSLHNPTTTKTATATAAATKCSTETDIPAAFKGTYNDPTTWLDMTDFNCSFTSALVGNLSIVGLNATWDDSKQANSKVPPLDKPWGSYSSNVVRGVSLGGWLSLEPFITPSLFNYDASLGIVDEYSLCKHLGPHQAAATLEKHYSTFVTEQDFADIAAAGLSHVRIPFSYWAVTTYPGDPYVLGISWRYLLRGIEWARRHGLRVSLDLHAVPGSQNGWNHSGRSGNINWITGPDGSLNAQRSLDIHNQLSRFFAQERYQNIVAFYGLVNEPGITIPQSALADWTKQAVKIVSSNGVSASQVFSEALRGLPAWQGNLQGYGDSLVIDVHEYEIFDVNLIVMKHSDKVSFVCSTYTKQISASMDTATGFGPTIVGEWSQADTDCALWVNGVGMGARWTGNFSGKSTPHCPTQDNVGV
ncbi:Glycoside hydrolase, subgroup, catalytic core [Niveomyces insectorum RCEF 264]|uniref:glucan 1,3-beta-glucosidase n=1 Tax=Niveomyces insectorum RCEF 264 TaxID=1081102 RepID=A0A167R8S8_9HYPO|nr:Glycoside hydrolase, subgroup, catalytic core [Niveomyces insectorum RCEF 264]